MRTKSFLSVVLFIVGTLSYAQQPPVSEWRPYLSAGLGASYGSLALNTFAIAGPTELSPILYPSLSVGIEKRISKYDIGIELAYQQQGFQNNDKEDDFFSGHQYSSHYLGLRGSVQRKLTGRLGGLLSLGLFHSISNPKCNICDIDFPPDDLTWIGPRKTYLGLDIGVTYELSESTRAFGFYEFPLVPRDFFSYNNTGGSARYRVRSYSVGIRYRLAKSLWAGDR